MQYLRIVVAQCLVAVVLLGQESITNKPLNKTSLIKNKSAAAMVSINSKASMTVIASDDEDVIVYNGDTKVVPKITRRSQGSYEVVYDGRMVIPLWTKERFQTTVILPPGEEIMRVVAADGNNWEAMFPNNSNHFYIKPRFPNSSTSINAITKSGNLYVFLATSNTANKNHEAALILDVLPPVWMQYGSVNADAKNGSQAIVLSGAQEPNASSAEEVERLCQMARKAGFDEAATKHEDDLRDYATSIFHKANMDYKWSRNVNQLHLKRVFDDGRVTYLVFESSLNIQPAFWEIDNGSRKDVTVQRSVFSPEVIIVGKLFKEGVLSIEKGKEIKISNRGWSISTKSKQTKTQLRGDKPSTSKKVE